MIPIWLRLVVAGIGVVLFFGSWFIGNTVDASHTPDSSRRESALLKDGLYTFNAESNIVRVLKGEADAYPGAALDGLSPDAVRAAMAEMASQP